MSIGSEILQEWSLRDLLINRFSGDPIVALVESFENEHAISYGVSFVANMRENEPSDFSIYILVGPDRLSREQSSFRIISVESSNADELLARIAHPDELVESVTNKLYELAKSL